MEKTRGGDRVGRSVDAVSCTPRLLICPPSHPLCSVYSLLYFALHMHLLLCNSNLCVLRAATVCATSPVAGEIIWLRGSLSPTRCITTRLYIYLFIIVLITERNSCTLRGCFDDSLSQGRCECAAGPVVCCGHVIFLWLCLTLCSAFV